MDPLKSFEVEVFGGSPVAENLFSGFLRVWARNGDRQRQDLGLIPATATGRPMGSLSSDKTAW